MRLVLSFFRSKKFRYWDTLTDRELTLKCVFLVALAAAKRRGELHALSRKVEYTPGQKGNTRTMLLHPVLDFMAKTHIKTNGLGALRTVEIPSLDDYAGPDAKEERLLCPVRCMKFYLARSDKYRAPEQKRLFISYQRGSTKDIAQQTLSRYLREAVQWAYESSSESQFDGNVNFKPHSVRHVATSLSALKYFCMSDILRAGAWASPDVFLSFYCQDYSVDSLTELSRLGGFVAAGAVI